MKPSFSLALRFLATVLALVLLYVSISMVTGHSRLQFDVTSSSLSSVSPQTREILSQLNTDVELISVFQASSSGSHRMRVESLMNTYAAFDHISCRTVDPIAEPAVLKPYTASGSSIQEGSVLVVSGNRFRVLPMRDMYSSTGSENAAVFLLEEQMTSAIQYATGTEQKQVYLLEGHGEATLKDCSTLISALEDAGYRVSSTSLSPGSIHPADLLIILSPVVDLTEDEQEMLFDLCGKGLCVFFALDASIDLQSIPRFLQFPALYSLSYVPGMVVEAESETDYWTSSPFYLMPHINAAARTLSAVPAEGRVILPGAMAISGPSIPLSGYTYETLLTSSKNASVLEGNSPAAPSGILQLAVSVEGSTDESESPFRGIFIGSLYTVMDSSLLSASYNLDITKGLIAWLSEDTDSLSIAPKRLDSYTLQPLTSMQEHRILIILLLLPLASLACGITVLIRRRRK